MIVTADKPKDIATLIGIDQVNEFKIKNSAKAFKILSDGLYANKVRAIIRELSCNAVDSHVEAGNTDIPYQIHLPTSIEPWFSIRDFGTGLTPDQVIDIYTTYFESTKTDSNDFIGALGLGSKSPFSYTENFSIVAIRDGVKGTFSAFINDQGVPSVATLGIEEGVSAPSGVEVRFTVAEKDFYKFSQEASEVFCWFDFLPEFIGSEKPKLGTVTLERDILPGVHRQIEDYSNSRKRSTYKRTTNLLKMGNIVYPIDLPVQQLNKLDFSHEVIEHEGLVIEVPIGAVDFQASREGLSYTPETVAILLKKYKEIYSLLLEQTREKLLNSHHDSPWEFFQAIRTISYDSLYTEVLNNIKLNEFNVANLYAKIDKAHKRDSEYHDFPIEQVIRWSNSKDGIGNVHIRQQQLDKLNIKIRKLSNSRSYYGDYTEERLFKVDRWRGEISLDITFDEGIHFVYATDDYNRSLMPKTKAHYNTRKREDDKPSTVFIIEPIDRKRKVVWARVWTLFGLPPASQRVAGNTLDKNTRSESKAANKNSAVKDRVIGMLCRDGNSRSYNNDAKYRWSQSTFGKITEEAKESKKKVVYVPAKGYKVNTDKSLPTTNFKDLIQAFRNIYQEFHVIGRIDYTKLYALREDDVLEAAEKSKHWISIWEAAQMGIDSITEAEYAHAFCQTDVKVAYESWEMLKKAKGSKDPEVLQINRIFDKFKKKYQFNFTDRYYQMAYRAFTPQCISRYQKAFGLEWDEVAAMSVAANDVKKLNEFKKRYELLHYIHSDTPEEVLKQFFTLMENA